MQMIGDNKSFYRSHGRAAGATTIIGNREYANFASYDYLGVNTDPQVTRRAVEAIERFNISASASRVVAGERPVHVDLERSLAKVYGVDAAVCSISGYLTNVTAISCLMGPQDLVIYDEFIHNSALAGIKQSGVARRLLRHNDTDNLDAVLRGLSSKDWRLLVIVEGVYSMDDNIADLPALVELKRRYGFWLMADEAYALSVLGESGCGSFEH